MAINTNEVRPLARTIKPLDKSIIRLAGKKPTKTETILLCVDGPGTIEKALSYVENYVSKLFPGGKIKIHLLQVITKDTRYHIGDGAVTTIPYSEGEQKQITKKAARYLDQTGEPLRNMGATVISKVKINKNAPKEIIKTAKEIKADLIVMFAHKRSWLDRLVFGSVSNRVLRFEDKIPIRIVRAS